MLGRCRTSLQQRPALEEASRELQPRVDSQNPRAFLHSVNEERLGLTAPARINPNTVGSQRAQITRGSYSPAVGRQRAVKNAHVSPR